MSLISNSGGSAAATPGTIQLFCSETPDGWKRMNDVYVDKSVFAAAGPRITLLPYILTAGALPTGSLTSASVMNDLSSPDHVYIGHGTALRRLNIHTGVSTPCASYSSSATGIGNSVNTPSGIFHIRGSAILWRYTPETDAWSQFVTNVPGGNDTVRLVFDEKRNRILCLQTAANATAASVAVDLATRAVTSLTWFTAGTASTGAAVVVDDTLLFTRGASLWVGDLAAETLTATEIGTRSGGLTHLGSGRVLAPDYLSSGGVPSLLTVAEGIVTAKPLSFTGLENATSGTLIPSLFTAGLVAGNNLFGVLTVAGTTVPVLISMADIDSEVPVADIFYARKL